MFDIEFVDVEKVKVAMLSGKLNTGTSPDAEEQIVAEIDAGAHNMVLHLGGVDYISSTGLRVILATGKKLMGLGGKLVVCELNPTVAEVFRISGFSQMLPVVETQSQALGEF